MSLLLDCYISVYQLNCTKSFRTKIRLSTFFRQGIEKLSIQDQTYIGPPTPWIPNGKLMDTRRRPLKKIAE